MFDFVDRWINRFDGNCCEPLSEDENLELLKANIMGRLAHGGTVLLAGDATLTKIQVLKEKLEEKLVGISVLFGGPVDTCPISLNAVSQSSGVVLVVQKGQSTHVRIEKQLACLIDLGKPVYGFVMV